MISDPYQLFAVLTLLKYKTYNFQGLNNMKNGAAVSIIVIAFVAGAFLPYFYLNGRIEETHSKLDQLIEYVKTNREKIDDVHSIVGLEKEANSLQEQVRDSSDQKVNEKAIVQHEDATELADQINSTN